jgi:hypothetical protein
MLDDRIGFLFGAHAVRATVAHCQHKTSSC